MVFPSISATNIIDLQGKSIAQELNIDNRTEQITKQQAFITLKDHKDNFANHPTCRLINPAKSKLEKVSKQFLANINSEIRKKDKAQPVEEHSRSNPLVHQHTR